MTTPDRDDNPYAPPEAATGVWAPARPITIEGRHLAVDSGSALPPICVRTGQPAPERVLTRQMSHAPLWLVVLAVAIPYIFLPVYLFARKTGRITFSLCEVDWRRRRAVLAINWGLLLLACAMYASMPLIFGPSIPLILAMAGILIANYSLHLAFVRGIHAARIEHGRIWLVGIPPPVMAALASAGTGDSSSRTAPSGEPASSTIAGPTDP